MRLYTALTFIFMSFAVIAQPCSGGMAGNYPCDGYDLLSHIPLSTFGATGGNDSWGWTDAQTGKEYALMGLNNGTAFIDISDPVNVVYLGKLPTHTSPSSWRDIKVYNNHAFIVSEAGGHGMQVFDLTRLRSVANPPETFTEDAHFAEFGSAHNIIINEATGFAYAVGAGSYNGGPIFINIQDPLNPQAAGGYSGSGYTHDAQVIIYDGPDPDYQGQEIYFASNANEVVIVNVTNKNNPQLISTITYGSASYTHQSWLTEDRTHIIIGDEIDELDFGFNTRAIIADVSDLDAPFYDFQYFGNIAAIDHNGYVKDNLYYLANYKGGMRVIDISDIGNSNMSEVGYFDTYPANNNAGFNGVWNVHPYFNSGNILLSDINTGFFMVRASVSGTDTTPPVAVCAPYTATLDTAGNVTITGSNVDGGSSDNSGFYSTTVSPNIFSCADVGAPITVTLTVSDVAGNSSTCTTEVIVVDNRLPTISCPGDMTDNPEPGSSFFTMPNFISAGGVVAADNCGVVSLTQTPPAGAQVALGSYTIVFEATDPSGNTNSCSFVLTVEELGINEYFAQGLSMSPNPASDFVRLNATNGTIDQIQLYSITGKVIDLGFTITQEGANFNVSGLSSGIYFLTINNNVIQKLIVR